MYQHKVHYFTVDEHLLAVIPSLDKTYLLKSFSERPAYIINQIPPIFPMNREARVKRVLMLTSGCNLNCAYCFEGNTHECKSMSVFDVQKIISEMFEEAIRLKKVIISFSLFGGEPTMNWKCVEAAVETADMLIQKTGIQCIKAIVTNGVMKPENAVYLARHFDNIYFSIDGSKEMFLYQRRPNDPEVFDLIMKNADYVYRHGKNVGFKTTITYYTIERMMEIENFFLLHFPFSSRMYQPVMTEQDNELYVDFGCFLRKFWEMKQYAPTKNVSCSLFKYEPSDRMCNLSIRNVVYPDLSVLACHRSNMCIPEDSIKKEFFIGQCNDGKIAYDVIQKEKMKEFYVDNIPSCTDCFVRYHCGGGCPAIKIIKQKNALTGILDYCQELKWFFFSTLLKKSVNSFHEHSCTENSIAEQEFYSLIQRRLN